MNDWRNKLINFMAGRYGTDNLNRFLLWVIIICWLIGFFGISVFSKARACVFHNIYLSDIFKKLQSEI